MKPLQGEKSGYTICANKERNGPPSADQGLSIVNQVSHHVHRTPWLTHPPPPSHPFPSKEPTSKAHCTKWHHEVKVGWCQLTHIPTSTLLFSLLPLPLSSFSLPPSFPPSFPPSLPPPSSLYPSLPSSFTHSLHYPHNLIVSPLLVDHNVCIIHHQLGNQVWVNDSLLHPI